MNKKKLIKRLRKVLAKSISENVLLDKRIEWLNGTINNLVSDVFKLKLELEIAEESLKAAENALEYKEIRENDNAEFIAKVLPLHNQFS